MVFSPFSPGWYFSVTRYQGIDINSSLLRGYTRFFYKNTQAEQGLLLTSLKVLNYHDPSIIIVKQFRPDSKTSLKINKRYKNDEKLLVQITYTTYIFTSRSSLYRQNPI